MADYGTNTPAFLRASADAQWRHALSVRTCPRSIDLCFRERACCRPSLHVRWASPPVDLEQPARPEDRFRTRITCQTLRGMMECPACYGQSDSNRMPPGGRDRRSAGGVPESGGNKVLRALIARIAYRCASLPDPFVP